VDNGKKKQLSSKSRIKAASRPPRSTVFWDSVEDS
jgi:hypothetical protein